MKVAMTKPVPESCIWSDNQIRASPKPVRVMSMPIMEAKIQAVIIIITIFCDIPETTTSENAVRSLQSMSPKPSDKIRTGQNPRSSGAPERAMVITPATNTKNGSNAPKAPP